MNNIPVTIIDNFFDDPNAIRKFALSQEFEVDKNSAYPGKRTKQLHELDKKLFDIICSKFFSIYYDFTVDNSINWLVKASFQLVDKSYNSGWIHQDANEIISGIIYLNDITNPKSGTSIYEAKNDNVKPIYTDKKHQGIKGEISDEEENKYRIENNLQFEESIKVNNKYNRLIAFDSNMYHAAQDFFGEDKESRLTLVIFVKELNARNTPISRFKSVK